MIASAALAAAAPNGVGATTTPSWHQIHPSPSPGDRNRFGMAYDPKANSTILFGGYDPFTVGIMGDTWELSSGKWTELYPTTSPSTRCNFVMVYDPVLGGILLYGGYGYTPGGGVAELNDTWLWANGTWTQLHPTSDPGPRENYAMAYDAYDSEVVLFGGLSAGVVLGDTWVYSGTTWTNMKTPASMPARQFAVAAYDSVDSQVILVSGLGSTNLGVAGTWAFHGGIWTKIKLSTVAPRPTSLAMGATAANGTVLLFGGLLPTGTYVNSLWEFSGGAWHKLVYSHPPSPRKGGGFVYNSKGGDMVEFGGSDSTSWLGDTWTLR